MNISYKVHNHLIVLQIRHLSFDYFLVYLHQTFNVFKNKQMHNYECTIGATPLQVWLLYLLRSRFFICKKNNFHIPSIVGSPFSTSIESSHGPSTFCHTQLAKYLPPTWPRTISNSILNPFCVMTQVHPHHFQL